MISVPEPSPPPPSVATTVRRDDRARYDGATVHAILDAASVGHVGLVGADGRPVVIPMLYGRSGDVVYLHASVATRLGRLAKAGFDACLTVTHLDGLVLARSAFHHSMEYRSVVVLGRVQRVEDDDEKLLALRVISDHLIPGRWDEVREPSKAEVRQTAVLRLPLAEASAKVRAVGVHDEPEDLGLPVWAGVLPVVTGWGEPVPAHDLVGSPPVSPSVERLRRGD